MDTLASVGLNKSHNTSFGAGEADNPEDCCKFKARLGSVGGGRQEGKGMKNELRWQSSCLMCTKP